MRIYLQGKNRRPMTDPDSFQDFLLAEVMEAECGQVIAVNGQTFVIGTLGGKTASNPAVWSWALASPVTLRLHDQANGTDDLECPVCGHQDTDVSADEDDHHECEHCGAILSFTSEVTRTFSAFVVERPEVMAITPEPSKELLALAHRYLYYVKNSPAISDREYDNLECDATIGLRPDSPLNKPGSDRAEDYSAEVKALAEFLLRTKT